MATTYVRGKVSKKKRRFVDKKNGFDLDLSYICNNIIAMGFPSEGTEGLYRNPYNEVLRFLDLRHKGHYKVYNLCSERGYDPSKFYDRVGKFAFDDHNAPRFGLIEEFCADVKAFINEAPDDNVAVIHCKAGKGRTGVMICCWLLYNREWDNAEDAMQYYAAMRTHNQKGVTIPSQRRYVNYFGRYMNEGMPETKTLYIQKLRFHGVPKTKKDGEIRYNVIMDKMVVATGEVNKKEYKDASKAQKKNDDLVELAITCLDDEKNEKGIPVLNDVKVEIYEKAFRYQETMFTFWFHTAFIADNYLEIPQAELDTALKDRSNKIYPKGFKVSVDFEEHQSDKGASPAAAASTSAAAAPSTSSKKSSKKTKKTRSKKQRSEKNSKKKKEEAAAAVGDATVAAKNEEKELKEDKDPAHEDTADANDDDDDEVAKSADSNDEENDSDEVKKTEEGRIETATEEDDREDEAAMVTDEKPQKSSKKSSKSSKSKK